MQQEVQSDERCEPNHTSGDGEAVKVLFRNGRAGQIGLHASAKEAGKSATLALVQQHGQAEQEAGDDQDDLQCEDQNPTFVRS